MLKFLLTALVALAAVGAAQGMSSGPTLNNCGKLVTKPKTFVIACGDGNYFLKKLSWRSWGGASAKASGTAAMNDCKPNCAAGKFHFYAAKVTASAIKSCGKHKEYSKLTIVYPNKHPAGVGKTDVVKLSC